MKRLILAMFFVAGQALAAQPPIPPPPSNYNPSSVAITGGSVDNTPIGSTTPSSVAATNLSANGTVSGPGFTSLLSAYLTQSLAAATYVPLPLPVGSTSTAGILKPDGSTITAASGVITTANSTICNTAITPGAAAVNTLGACSFGALGANNINVSGTVAPVTGIYRQSTNTLNFSTNSTVSGFIDANHHWHFGASSPTTSNGTLDGTATDTTGTVIEGTASTGATITWNIAYTTAPDCVVTSPTGSVLTSYTPGTTTLVITNASATGDKFTYDCHQ